MMQRILVADDNDESLYYLQALFSAGGYEVVATRNGTEALQSALTLPPALIVTDILMPVMDGFTLCRIWRGEPRLAAIPFVLYTATYTDPKDRELGLSIGADEFVVKPAEPDVLLEIVRDLLRRKEAGTLPNRSTTAPETDVFLREYNAALVRKLEDKLVQLEAANQKLTGAQLALKNLSGRLIEEQEKERSRIGRELHDDISQKLAILAIDLDKTLQAAEDTPVKVERRRAERRSSESARLTRLKQALQRCLEIADAVQELSHELHSSSLDYLGVVSAVRQFCKEFSKQHRVTVDFTSADIPNSLSRNVSLCLFRIVQEALRNAVKHSQVVRMEVCLRGAPDEIALEVRDAGVGFDPDNVTAHGGLGLISMRERANFVGGMFSIESKPNAGTKIKVKIPL